MAQDVKRGYRSPLREESARQKQIAVRDAAAGLFITKGYVATTIREIADAAGVATRTVFNAFPGGKADIFDAALDAALGDDEERTPLYDRPVATRALAEETPAGVVQLIADGAAELYQRAGKLIHAYLGSAGADPHMRQHAEAGAREATKIMRRYARALDQRGALRERRTVPEATDLLLTLCSPHVHHLLCNERRWTTGAYRRWLADELAHALLRPSVRPRHGG